MFELLDQDGESSFFFKEQEEFFLQSSPSQYALPRNKDQLLARRKLDTIFGYDSIKPRVRPFLGNFLSTRSSHGSASSAFSIILAFYKLELFSSCSAVRQSP